jgi:hypothetical protein
MHPRRLNDGLIALFATILHWDRYLVPNIRDDDLCSTS